MAEERMYYSYSEYLKEKYGEKVYKLRSICRYPVPTGERAGDAPSVRRREPDLSPQMPGSL